MLTGPSWTERLAQRSQEQAILDDAGEVRDMGFKVGLHTAGIYPRRLAAVLPLAERA